MKIIKLHDQWVVVDKPAPLLVHPTRPDGEITLWHHLQEYFPGESLCLMNRLDRETSGLVLVGRNSSASSILGRQTMAKAIRKRYEALVYGDVPEQGSINEPIGREADFGPSEIYVRQIIHPAGKEAITRFRRIASGCLAASPLSRVEVELLTGRMHQIRVHFQHIGHPVVGDKLYGPDPEYYLRVHRDGWDDSMLDQLLLRRQALHASRLEFEWDGEVVVVESPLPPDLASFANRCGLV